MKSLIQFIIFLLVFELHAQDKVEYRYRDLGDPKNIVAGAKLNKNLPSIGELEDMLEKVIHTEIRTYKSFDSAKYVNGIHEKKLKKDEHKKHNQNKPYVDRRDFKFKISSIEYEDEKEFIIKLTDVYHGEMSLHFSVNDGVLSYIGEGSGGDWIWPNVKSAELLHFSKSKNSDDFSLLLYTEYNLSAEKHDIDMPEVGKYVTAITFSTQSLHRVLNSGTIGDNYLFKDSKSWADPKKINIDICLEEESDRVAAKAAIESWNNKTIININYEVLSEYPPFTDLNTNCIYGIKNYETMAYSYHLATSQTVLGREHIAGNDILYYKDTLIAEAKEFELSKSQVEIALVRLFEHELGHSLGLAHVTSKTNFFMKSIMAKDKNIYEKSGVSFFDIWAIYELYNKEKLSAK